MDIGLKNGATERLPYFIGRNNRNLVEIMDL